MPPNENDVSSIALRQLFNLWKDDQKYVICQNYTQVDQMLYICGVLGDKRYNKAYQYGRQGYVYFYNDLGTTVCYGSDIRTKEVEFPTFLSSVMEELACPSKNPVSLLDYIGGDE